MIFDSFLFIFFFFVLAARINITINIEDTIYDVKIKILQRCNIQLGNQELYYHGVLLENDKNVYDYKIVPSYVIFFF